MADVIRSVTLKNMPDQYQCPECNGRFESFETGHQTCPMCETMLLLTSRATVSTTAAWAGSEVVS